MEDVVLNDVSINFWCNA